MTSTALTWYEFTHPPFEIVFDVNDGTVAVCVPPTSEVTVGSTRNVDSTTSSARAVMPLAVTGST